MSFALRLWLASVSSTAHSVRAAECGAKPNRALQMCAWDYWRRNRRAALREQPDATSPHRPPHLQILHALHCARRQYGTRDWLRVREATRGAHQLMRVLCAIEIRKGRRELRGTVRIAGQCAPWGLTSIVHCGQFTHLREKKRVAGPNADLWKYSYNNIWNRHGTNTQNVSCFVFVFTNKKEIVKTQTRFNNA